MQKGNDLIGIYVVEKESGEIIGRVEDILYSPVFSSITGIVINNKNKFFCDVNNINKIGEDIIIIKDKDKIDIIDEIYPGLGLKEDANTIMGNRVISEEGKELGIVIDLIIDEKEKRLLAYELSGGLVDDLLNGRKVLTLDKYIKYGKDLLIVNMKRGI